MSQLQKTKKNNISKFKRHDIDTEFSSEKFGKCPLKLVNKKSNEKIEPSIYFNPKNEWSDSPIEALQSALNLLTGTQDLEVASEIIDRAVSAMPLTHTKDYNTNVIYQSLSECEPKDAIESKLCAQSASLYAQGMQYLSRAESADMLHQVDFYMKSAIKLLRLHNETVETLARYRRKGEQKVIVQYVNVNDGGKAIVGNMIA